MIEGSGRIVSPAGGRTGPRRGPGHHDVPGQRSALRRSGEGVDEPHTRGAGAGFARVCGLGPDVGAGRLRRGIGQGLIQIVVRPRITSAIRSASI
jgi:hypothetical protein